MTENEYLAPITSTERDQALASWPLFDPNSIKLPAGLTEVQVDDAICEHGLSASLCYGPEHYCSPEEIAHGW